ncbi:MAG TPA: cytochrome c oxidase subunit I [Dehalococcoidia bacterium]|nr:cytochrome c oxidase subunit I [Dehalococcoidia bacterium]
MATAVGRLRRTWEAPSIIANIFATVDHKQLGIRYMVTAAILLGEGGLDGIVMRTQLAIPNSRVVSPDHFDQMFSLHGTVLIFFFATPMVVGGFGNYLVPLMLGTRDLAFPRLNAFSYWVYLFSAAFIYASFFVGGAPNAGWFAYPPLSSQPFTPGLNMDFWAIAIFFLGISTTATAMNFIVTIFRMRAPGMSINRMPLFIWGILATSFAIIFALPPLTLATGMLEFDRQFGTKFFDPNAGGNVLLWQHLFWIFGHPEVYILFIPAIGIVSTIIPTFVRTRVVGYVFLVLATVGIAFISFGVWVHHMFATGLDVVALSFFGAAGMSITIPSGLQIFSWIATIWKGEKIIWSTSFMFIVGFLVLIVMGGFTGVMVSLVPLDWQVTDSYFIVAHLHYVLVGGVVFPIFGGFYYWIPKFTGRMMNEKLGQLNFWLFFIGFNVSFFPMHILGLLGMQRRIFTYPTDAGWMGLNLTSTIGAYIMGLGALVFIWNFAQSMIVGELAGDNPWEAGTLEWATTSPPEPYNFREIPVVRSADPLWDDPPREGWDERLREPAGHQRETYATTLLEPEVETRLVMPEDSYTPFFMALSLVLLMIGILRTDMVMIAVAGAFGLVFMAWWMWPAEELA